LPLMTWVFILGLGIYLVHLVPAHLYVYILHTVRLYLYPSSVPVLV
jgi:hypothetical protein